MTQPSQQAAPAEKPGASGRAIDVSFIVAAYNAAPFIEAAVRSALAQQDVRVEVIVVDDASRDDTAARVATLAEADDRVRVLRRSSNGGPSAARNMGIEAARGAWLAVLDGDDLVTADRSARLLALAAATSADIVADNFARMDAAGRPLGTYMLAGDPGIYAVSVDAPAFVRGNALFDRHARLGAIKPMIRTDMLRRLGLRYREDLHNGEDYVLLLEALLASARFVVSGEPLYLYRVHAGSISWRIDLDRLARLEQVHASLDLSRASGELTSAVEHYVGCLAAARAMTTTVEHAKAGRWSDALAMAAGTPRAWPLLGRTLTAAVAKRLSRALWRPMDTSAARDARVSR
ncbi:MAG: glycosyltransferase family 2 protein [Hyphomicrobiaceae bacterium]